VKHQSFTERNKKTFSENTSNSNKIHSKGIEDFKENMKSVEIKKVKCT